MLINALCEYYDELAKEGKVVPDGYSEQAVHYIIALTPDGKIDKLIPHFKEGNDEDNKGKKKERLDPDTVVLPQRTEKSGIESNIIEHRPLYIFGLILLTENI